jgi:hypothetical protein
MRLAFAGIRCQGFHRIANVPRAERETGVREDNMPSNDVRISASVGRNGANQRDDVLTVQKLVNDHLPKFVQPLEADGQCGPLTIAAIEDVQTQFLRMSHPDGRVDPGGDTFRFLTGSSPAPKPHPGARPSSLPQDVIIAAQNSHKKWKVPASVTLAQWALESGWGQHMPPGSFNPFGMKAAEGQPFVEVSTREVIHGQSVQVVARFRKFASFDEAFDHHGELLATRPVYRDAMALVDNPDDFADALTGVYATDPEYGHLLKSLMTSHDLYQYD